MITVYRVVEIDVLRILFRNSAEHNTLFYIWIYLYIIFEFSKCSVGRWSTIFIESLLTENLSYVVVGAK